MSKKNIGIADKLNRIFQSWELHAPETKLAGMTLAEFKSITGNSLEIRESILTKRTQLNSAMTERAVADKANRELVKRVVYAILSDVQFGANSGFYRSLGYVPAIARNSGLVRQDNTADTAAATAPTAPTA